MIVSNPSHWESLRKASGEARIEIDADPFLKGNQPLYLMRSTIFALQQGGEAIVRAPRSLDAMGVVPGAPSFQFLVQIAAKAIDGLGVLIHVDVPSRTFRFQRTAPTPSPEPWSAVVIFSGREEELPFLRRCTESLLLQPELAEGGQVAICGPAAAQGLVAGWPGVEYLVVETPSQAGRFLVGRKKNAAAGHLCHEKILVCHARIVLEPGCLSRMPKEFDVITPRVSILNPAKRRIPYLDLLFIHLAGTFLHTQKPLVDLGYPRRTWRDNLAQYLPYVDGGLFCARRSLLAEVPLSEVVAWGEGEDVEWCQRVLMAGRMVELCPDAEALSLSNKTLLYHRFSHVPGFRLVSRLVRQLPFGLRRLLR